MSRAKEIIKRHNDREALYNRLKLVPVSLPESLNDYFADSIKHMGNVLQFMRKYMGEDYYVKKLIETYDTLPPRMKHDNSKVDLDWLADKAGVERIILRERILVAISRWSESKYKLTIAMYSDQLVQEIIATALDSSHPDSQDCKELLAKTIGITPVPKSATIQINTQVNQDNRSIAMSNELPSLHETLSPIEQTIKGYQERKLLEGQDQFIDLDEVENVDAEYVTKLVEGEDYTDEEEDE